MLWLLLYLLPLLTWSQASSYWRAAVVAEDIWSYHSGQDAPPANWRDPDFDDRNWPTGPGGIGYADGDDNTVIAPTVSLYLRKEFTLADTALLTAMTLFADYDDAFVAYLNGVEIGRANIGVPGFVPPHNATATTYREAQLYQGGLPESFPIPLTQLDGLWRNGTNTLAVQIHNSDLASSDLSALFYLLVGLQEPTTDYRAVPDWFTAPFESSNLPLLVIHTDGVDIPDEPKIDAHLGIVDHGPGNRNSLTDPFNGYDGRIGIELRGSSSLSFPKKNYGFETRRADGRNNNVSLLGLPAENDWILHGPYSDKSLMRNVLSFHIGNAMGRYAPRTRWCEVFLNDGYLGVYVLMEKIKRDDNRVDIANLRSDDISGDELTGGYIFSIDRDDDGPESGWYSPYTDAVFYRYRDPNFDELLPVQKEYLRNYVNAFETAMTSSPSASTYEDYIDVPSWIDYWLATELFKHIDNFKFSFYMYKKKDSNGGKIHFGPLWDLNLGYGNFDFVRDPGPEGWSYVWTSSGFLRPFWVLALSDDPSMQHRINCRWAELRQGSLRTADLLQFIDQNAALLAEAQQRNFARWPVLGTYIWPNSFVGDTYAEEVDFLKNWLTARLAWMDENMLGDCALMPTDEADSPPILRVFPNPFQQQVHFQLTTTTEAGQLLIFDLLGKLVFETTLDPLTSHSLSLRQLASGMYFYQFSVNQQVLASGKLVKD
jgi:hypothetical protein